jgi:GGDEF domain-containing protein
VLLPPERELAWSHVTHHSQSLGAEIARSPAAWERLAKNWMLEVIERSPLEEVNDLPLGWISHEAAPLIAEILGLLSDPGAARELRLSPAALERAASLAAVRDPEALVKRLPGEFAALQSLLIEALDRELPDRDRREFTRAVTRLAEVFGAVQAAAMESLVERDLELDLQPGPASAPTVSPHPAESDPFEECLMSLIAEQRRTGVPVAIAHFEVEGVERISKGYGAPAADQMVEAVAGVVAGQLSGRERAFRTGFGQLLAVLPGMEAVGAVNLATAVSDIVERSQSGRGPRVEVAVGLASCPLHATTADGLREAGEVAAWDARASGRGIAIATVATHERS